MASSVVAVPRTQFNSRTSGFDDPLVERPDSSASRGERVFFRVWRGYLGLTIAIHVALGLATLLALIANPAAGAVVLAVLIVGLLIYKS
jgi:hypothetical protein